MRKWLDLVAQLAIKRWHYKDNLKIEHIGPMADQWKAVTGYGDGLNIDGMDAIGICLKCIQELTAEVDSLKREIAELKNVHGRTEPKAARHVRHADRFARS